MHWELLKNCYSQYSELSGNKEKHRDKAQQLRNQVPRTMTYRSVDDLFILAQSAEIVVPSDDNVAVMDIPNHENKGLYNDLIDQMSQKCAGNINENVTRTRLTQIRKQARCKDFVLDQEMAEDSYYKRSQGKTVRLDQIKHQARCKRNNDLSPQIIREPRNEQPKDKILRLSQMKHKARSKGNPMIKNWTEKHMDRSLPCSSFKGNKNMITRQFVEKYIHQGVMLDIENVKQYQRTARQLRAFKTKQLKQLLRIKCKKKHDSVRLHEATRTSLIGLAAANTTVNSEARKELISVKRFRLTQFKREARLGNHCHARTS